MSQPSPKLYDELAAWWPLLSTPADYRGEADLVRAWIEDACTPSPTTLLELGSGGGNNASHLKSRFRMTLVDRSPEMLAVSRALNPECEHVCGDMRTIRLGRVYDAVFIHDALMYMTTEADLRSAIETGRVHCRDAGAIVLAPDCTRESFAPATRCGGHDEHDRHLLGLFSRTLWLALLTEAGFAPRAIIDDSGRECFVGVKTRQPTGGAGRSFRAPSR